MIDDDHEVPLLGVTGLTKRFAGVTALDDVHLDIVSGEVHCILGQNGAGKSTLIKTLSGAHRPDSGEIRWEGDLVEIPDTAAAIRLGIATMYQELDIVEGLTVAENIFLGHERASGGLIRRGETIRSARELLARLGHESISPNAEVGSLSAANQQIVSMARALSHEVRLIIMDEPSAVLDSQEVKNLFNVVRSLTAAGIAVVYITHRLEEIREIGDRITVIKDGRTMATGLPASGTPTSELIRLMTGRAIENVFPSRNPVPDDAPIVLEVDDLCLTGSFEHVSLTARAGEIIGLAGLVGSGRSEILETIYGARRATSGRVAVGGHQLRRGSVEAAVAAGIGLSPEERKRQGLILDQPVYANITLSSMVRFARAGFLDTRSERRVSRDRITALQLRPADPDRPASTLSGGNQQKILLARWLVHGTRVLLLDEPTRGVDVGARAEIYVLIRDLAAAGNSIIVVSSEIEEVIGLSDRVLVVADGRVISDLPASSIDEHGVLDLVMKGMAA